MDLTATRQTWKVKSMSGRDLTYVVRLNRSGDYSCSCPDHVYRRRRCKHIAAIAPEPRQRSACGHPRNAHGFGGCTARTAHGRCTGVRFVDQAIGRSQRAIRPK
jgi:SWIM zinc finger